MRKIFQAIPILCTVLLFGLGAFLPSLSAQILDQRLELGTMLLEHQGFSFALEQDADFFQTLELFGRTHSEIELSEGHGMKAEDAAAAAVEARMQLSTFNTVYDGPEVTPLLLLTSRSTSGLSGIFWRCVWRESTAVPDGMSTSVTIPTVLWLDDQSGRMVSFSGQMEQATLSAPNTIYAQSAINAAEYCRLNYPVDTVKLTLTNENHPDGRYTVNLLKNENGQEKSHSIAMRLADGWLSFNT